MTKHRDSAPPAATRVAEPNGAIGSYVAMGDSFSEGLMDPDPSGAEDRFFGWADRLAVALTTSKLGGADLQYANLAIRGRLLGQIVDEQLQAALDLHPDFVTLVAGGNDCMRPAADIDGLAAKLERAVIALRAEGIRVLLGNGFDTENMSPVFKALRPRVGIYNSHLWTIAYRHGAMMLDMWGLRRLYRQEMWAPDRVHLSTAGHRLIAETALATLENEARPGIGFRLPHGKPRPVARALREETDWAREHLAPWVGRRLHRTSSGAGMGPKYPRYVPALSLGSAENPTGEAAAGAAAPAPEHGAAPSPGDSVAGGDTRG